MDERSSALAFGGASQQIQKVNLRENLLSQRAYHEREVYRINELLDLMDKNPDFEKFTNLLQGRY